MPSASIFPNARTALVTDVEVVDDYPASVLVHAQSFASLVWHYGSQLLSFGNGLTIAPFTQLSAAAASGVWLLLIGAGTTLFGVLYALSLVPSALWMLLTVRMIGARRNVT